MCGVRLTGFAGANAWSGFSQRTEKGGPGRTPEADLASESWTLAVGNAEGTARSASGRSSSISKRKNGNSTTKVTFGS